MDRLFYFDELPFGLQGGVMIPKSDFIKEHVNLIKILKSGTKADRQRELKDQTAELKKIQGGATNRKDVLKAYNLEDKGYSLKELSSITGVSVPTLQEVYNRGIGAYKTNPLSVRLKGSFAKGVNAPMSKKLSKEQWAMARVYSFLNGNPKHDTDLRSK